MPSVTFKLYISLVRSQLLYCAPVWRPHLLKDISKIEQHQRRATKYILQDFSSDYKTQLTKLNLLPLMYIFEISDIIFFVNSLKHPTPSFNINLYISFSHSTTRSNSVKLHHNISFTNKERHFYFNRICHLWNSLPIIDISLPIEPSKDASNLFSGIILSQTSILLTHTNITISVRVVTVSATILS